MELDESRESFTTQNVHVQSTPTLTHDNPIEGDKGMQEKDQEVVDVEIEKGKCYFQSKFLISRAEKA